jgi:nitric oxide reductase NorQ protein
MSSGNYDLAYVVNGTIEHTSGSKQDSQVIMFRPGPDGKTRIAWRHRSFGADRWDNWNLADDYSAVRDTTMLNPWEGVAGSINPANVFGMTDGPQGQKIGHYYSNKGMDSDYSSYTVTVVSKGFKLVSHDEIQETFSEAKIPTNLSSRLRTVHGLSPRMTGSATNQTPEKWITQATDFSTTRWASGMFAAHPRGAYNFSPFAGVVAPTPAGEKVVIEKRTFETHYTRPNGEVYYSRSIGEHADVDVLIKAREHNENVLLYGPPGTGKTALAEAAYCSDGESELITLLGTAETEIADFVGAYTQRPGEGFVWVDGPLVEAMEQGKVLLIDEIGLIDPKVLSVVYSVMDGRGELRVTQNPDRGTVHAESGFFVIAATNPHAPGVQLSEALISRFTVQVEVDSDYELAEHLGVNKKVVKAAKLLDKQRLNGTVLWAPQLRELFAYKRNKEIFGANFAARSLIAGAPEIDRLNVADVLSKALGETLSPLRMEG